MHRNELVATVQAKFEALAPYLNEHTRRLWAAVEARALGRGGISITADATRLSRTTIHAGLDELQHTAGPQFGAFETGTPPPIRRPGPGRKPLTAHDTTLLQELDRMLEPATPGDAVSPLQWTCKSTAKLAEELRAYGHQVSQRTVAAFLKARGYCLQAARTTRNGTSDDARQAQFLYIYDTVQRFQ